jgi:uncharacterized heparinase superfamily protein
MIALAPLWHRARWYVARLAAMPPQEIPHRMAEAARKQRWRRSDRGWNAFADIGDGRLAALPGLRDRLGRMPATHAVIEGRTRALAGEVQLLGRDWLPLTSIDWRQPPTLPWFHDPISGSDWPAPPTHGFAIDVRSTGFHLGDVKYVWELNRLQLLHPLACAMAREHDRDARAATLAIIASWAAANPPYQGVNWISGIELAMRLVSIALLVAALDPDTLTSTERTLIRRMVAAHAHHLQAFPSLHSSANNHRLAEGLGLFLAGVMLPDLARAAPWMQEGRHILEEEAQRQILADGTGLEQSPTYQAFAMEMLAFAARIAEDQGEPLSPALIERLALGAGFLRWLLDDEGRAPAIGDDDEGRVLAQPPDREPRYVASIVAAIAGLTGRHDLAPPRRDGHWRDGLFDSPRIDAAGARARGVRIFREGGYTCAKETIGGRRCHLVFDHGALGFGPLSAHGHADALAIWLTIDGQPVFIDAGTYLYFSGRETRTRLRESLAHNTLAVAGTSHSRARTAFGWSSQARARLLDTNAAADAWSVTATHDGYLRAFGVRHIRRITRVPLGYDITDALEGATRPLPVTLGFLCHPDIVVSATEGRTVEVADRDRLLCRLTLPPNFTSRIEHGDTEPTACWSPGFGQLAPTSRLVLEGALGAQTTTTRIEIAEAQAAPRSGALAVELRHPAKPASLDAHAEQPA